MIVRPVLMFAFVLLSCVPMRTPPAVTVLSRSTDQRIVVSSTQHELSSRYLTVATRSVAGHQRRWDLQIAYTRGLYWWWWQPALDLTVPLPDALDDEEFPGKSSFLYTDQDRIAVITPMPGPALAIRTMSARAASLAGAEREVFAQIARRPSMLDTPAGTTVSLRSALGDSFGAGEGSAVIRAPKIEAVTYTDGRWRIRLRGAIGDRAEVILNDKYQVLEARKLP